MKWLLPRIETCAREALVLATADIVYDSSAVAIYVGDGTTSGGNLVGGGGGGLTSANVCGMLSAYLTSNNASATYLTKGSSSAFIKPDEVSTLVCGMLSGYLTSQGASSTYQPIGTYLTSSLTTAQACALVESYGYASVDYVSTTYLTKASSSSFVKSAEVCTMLCAALSGYITSNNASATYLTKVSSSAFIKDADVCTLVCGMLSGYITSNNASATYLTKVSSSAFLKSADIAEYMTSNETSAAIVAFNYMISVCNVSAGTYGTSNIIPQIVVNEAGIITDIVRVTAPAGAGGGITSAEACAIVEGYNFISIDAASATYLTKASSSAFLKSADVCAMTCVALSGYITSNDASATYLTKVSSSAFLKSADIAEYMTSNETSAAIVAFNYLVSTCNVSAGTYGTSTIIPQIVVNEAGIITDIVRVTAPAGGGAVALDDITDVSSDAATSGATLTYISGQWIASEPQLIYRNVVSASISKNDAVETTITNWALTLSANRYYEVEWRLWVFAASVPDFKVNLRKSDTNTTGRYSNTVGVLTMNTLTSVNTALAQTVPGSTFYMATYAGYLITGASSTNMWVTFAQNVSTGATSCLVLPGSRLQVWKY